MNSLDQLLRRDLSRRLDRLAASTPGGTLAFLTANHPGLRERLDQMEARLAGLRAEMLERYAAWAAALDEMENLWGLAGLKAGEPESTDPLREAA